MQQVERKEDTSEQQLARKFLQETDCNIFLTGKAGTGKTTFLSLLQKELDKRMVITAPTGVAAINAGGVTLHSFFQRPLGPYVPGSIAAEKHNIRREKVNIMRNLDLLVIDEISMVRADLLDSIDGVLRRYRRNELPFGGVQLLMIGDLYQLPPVVKESEWQILRQHYTTPYFFSSLALRSSEMQTIEFTRIFRQRDSRFISLLNRVRENRVEEADLQLLNSRYQLQSEIDGAITLCSHNSMAERINQRRLAALAGRSRSYSAEVSGEFPESTWPTVERLELKVGAQVMFVRNDTSQEKLFYNGKIGRVLWLDSDRVGVFCEEDNREIEVKAVSWENVEYSLNEETMELDRNAIGNFRQLPLKLAWAITIHKSQGLTFDQVIIDAQAAFAHGQTYVALSRCRSLEGLTLARPIGRASIKTDSNVSRFSSYAAANPPTEEQLAFAAIRYQQKLLLHCFDFSRLGFLVRRFLNTLLGNASSIQLGGIGDPQQLAKDVEMQIIVVGENFCRQLSGLFAQQEGADGIAERVSKAYGWFDKQFRSFLLPMVENFLFDTDNKQLRSRIKRLFKEMAEEILLKHAAVSSCEKGFSTKGYLRAIGTAAVQKIPTVGRASKKAAIYSEEDIAHPDFFAQLKKWRKKKAEEKNVPAYCILPQKPLVQLIIHLPMSKKALLAIHGIGAKIADQYGDELLEMIGKYRREHRITDITLPDIPAGKEF